MSVKGKSVIKIDRNFFPPDPYKKVALYVRVSSPRQSQLDSMASQASGLVQMVASDPSKRLVDIYIDVRSGETQSQRQEFQRMLSDAQAKKMDIIITKSISRFGRNTEEAIRAIRELSQSKVEVRFIDNNISTAADGSEFIISILSAYAQAENASRRANQLWGIHKRLEDGTSELYRRKCFGYRKNNDGLLEINEPEAEIVRFVFNLYLSGASILMIQKKLADAGYKTATGKDTWSKLAITKMLTNEKYTGRVVVAKPQGRRAGSLEENGGYIVEDAHPVIIDRETFDTVQHEMAHRSNIVKDEYGSHRKETRYTSTYHDEIEDK